MAEAEISPGLNGLSGRAALLWAADCVEHLAQQVGDTPDGDVASCVGLARKNAQAGYCDSAAAHAQLKSLRRARGKLAVRPGGSVRAVVGFALGWAAETALLREAGWRDEEKATDTFKSVAESPSEFSRRERELNGLLSKLLAAAEALCGADPHVAAREAVALCREADPTEESWQLERFQGYRQPPPSTGQAAGLSV